METNQQTKTKTKAKTNHKTTTSANANAAVSPDQIRDLVPIKPRAFSIYPHPLPCFLDKDPQSKDEGIIFIKLQKCASSTIAAIVRDISKKYGKSLPKDDDGGFKNMKNTRNGANKSNQQCKHHSVHGYAFNLAKITQRKKDKSFLFTFLREPTDRFISDFFYHGISKSNHYAQPSLDNFLHFSNELMQNFTGYGGYEFPYLLTDKQHVPPFSPEYMFWNPAEPSLVQNPTLLVKRVEGILEEFDFIGLVSRIDESLVALGFILNLPLVDLLHVKSKKTSGNYDYNARLNTCFQSVKSRPTEDMKVYFESKEWKAKIAGDDLLFHAANLSLNRTIEMIGKEKFGAKLQEYNELKDIMFELCGSAVCSTNKCSLTGEVVKKNPKCSAQNCAAVAWNKFVKQKGLKKELAVAPV